jgi:phospholipid/cholesterol/gamma-HCH transport system substrate-binding protein
MDDSARRAGANSGSTDSDYELGHALVERGDLAEAEAAFARADQAGHPTAAACVGMFAEKRGELDKARAAYERADERGDWMGAMRLGFLYSRSGDWDRARNAWNRAGDRPRSDTAKELEDELFGGDEASTRGLAPRSPFAQPVLIGAVTVLITVIAVVLAFTANAGLPFVPTRELRVDIVDGSDLVVGNDVREGGFRIGEVSAMKAVTLPDGQSAAQLTLQLSESHGKIPTDSTATVLSRSALGLKYVNINVGRARTDFGDGGVMPIGQTSVPVQLDQIYGAFNGPTRKAIAQATVSSGNILAGRGSALNDTFAVLPSLLKNLEPVARYLSAPSTGLSRFFVALNDFMGTVAPVAQQNEEVFADAATTFQAISSSAIDLEDTIQESPSTEQVSTQSLAVQQPFLVDLTNFGNDLTPATEELKEALPNINPAIEAGTKTLARTPSLNANLQQVMGALKELVTAPGTNIALNGLSATVETLDPIVKYLGPYISVCNDWNYWWTDLAGDVDEETTFGYAQRALLQQAVAAQTNNIGSAGANAPVDGGIPNTPAGGDEYLHDPAYGAAVDSNGDADCETGQRGYPLKLNHFDPQGRDLDTDQYTPGDQGTTWTGLTRVPKGETFSRAPITGPQTPYNSSNP